jgi:hypothetical protein
MQFVQSVKPITQIIVRNVYKTRKCNKTIHRIFDDESVIIDNVLKCSIEGSKNIQGYYDDVEDMYTDITLTKVIEKSPNHIQVCWSRQKDDGGIMLGRDEIYHGGEKIASIISNMDEEMTYYHNLLLDYGSYKDK